MKKVIIVGAGIAGMSAGIYLQEAGFETEIYEKNSIPGGQCIGWKREGYFIDNCIDWLTGSKKGNQVNDVWQHVGALGKGVELVENKKWYSDTIDGKTLTFWRDIEKTRKEMLEIAPEDTDEINKFVDSVNCSKNMLMPIAKPMDMMSPLELIKMGMSMKGMMKLLKLYGKEDLSDYSSHFKNKFLRRAFTDYLPGEYAASALFSSYGIVVGENGDIPKGGSLAMSMRMADKYKSVGGKIHFNSDVEKVLVSGKIAKGIKLSSGETVTADYVVLATDVSFTFSKLLDKKYTPKALAEEFEDNKKYPVGSTLHVAFAVDGKFSELDGTNVVHCKPFKIAKGEVDHFCVKDYNYESSFAPEGKSVVQVRLSQSEDDYFYWKELYGSNPEKYKAEKQKAAEGIMNALIEDFPFLAGKIRIIDSWTPVTYTRYCNSYHGSYMCFVMTKNSPNKIIPGVIKGLDNAFIASQWLMSPGGTITAVTMGKFAAQRIMKKEKLNYIV